MAELATAWVNIVPSMKNAGSAITKQLASIDTTTAGRTLGGNLSTGLLKTAGTGLSTLGKLGLGALATIGGGITALAATGGIDRALNIENAQAKLEGLGHSAEEITEIMNNANTAVKGTAYGLDEAATVAAAAVAAGVKPGEQLTQVLTTIGDTAQIAGLSFQQVGNIFNSVMARGKLQGDDMLQLTSQGVPVLQALSQQLGVTTADVSDMVTDGKIDFQTFADAMQNYLGGSAQAAGKTFTGALANVRAALNRVGQKFATPGLDALRDLMNQLTPVIDQVAAALTPFADQLGTILTDAAAKATPLIQEFSDALANGDVSIEGIVGNIGLLAGGFATLSAVGGNAGGILDVLGGAGGALSGVSGGISAEFGKIKSAVSAAGGLFDDLGTRWGNALGLLDANFGGLGGILSKRVSDALSSAGTTITGLFDSKIYVPLQQVGGRIAEPFRQLAGRVSGFLSPVTSAFGTAFQGFGGTLGAAAQTALGKVGGIFTTFFNPSNFIKYMGIAGIVAALVAGLGMLDTSMQGQLTAMIANLSAQLPAMLATLTTQVTTFLPQMIAQGAMLLTTLMDAISANAPQLMTTAVTIVTTLVNGLAAQLPTLVPAALNMIVTLVAGLLANVGQLIDSGMQLLLGLVQGVMNALPQLIAQAPTIIGNFASGIASNLPRILQTGIQILSSLASGLVSAVPQLIGQIPAIIQQIWNAFTSVDWADVGMNILTGIASGITGAVGSLVDAAVGAAKSAIDTVKGWLGIASPSKRARDEIGRWIPAGVGKGITDNLDTVEQAGETLAEATLDKPLEAQATLRDAIGKTNAQTLSTAVAMTATPAGTTPAETGTGDDTDLLDMLARILEAITDADTTIQLDGREMGRMVRRYANA